MSFPKSESDKKDRYPQRVVSLLGASTETLYRLGLEDRLVGRSHECDYPPRVLALPCISRPRLDVAASSSAIDAAVRTHAAAGQPIYRLDDAALATLRPDLVIAQDHCRVCAITPDELRGSDACSGVPQLIVRPSTLDDCLGDVVRVAEAMGYSERGRALKTTLEGRLQRVRDVVSEVAAGGVRPRVALCEWCDPIMGCGYWLPELVDVAGGAALNCPPPGGATPSLSFETLLDSRPDVVVFALCGFDLSRAAHEIRSAWGAEKMARLDAACGGRIFVADGNHLVNRSGPRVVESAEALAEAVHPALKGHWGHFGTEYLTTLQEALAMVDDGKMTGDTKMRPAPFDEKTAREKLETDPNTTDETQNMALRGPPVVSPGDVVRKQLGFMEKGNMVAAFALNSKANQDRWCAPERFEAVLKSHTDYCRLLLEPAEVSELNGPTSISDDGETTTVQVILPAGGNQRRVELIWTMVTEEPQTSVGGALQWRTEKVGAG